MIHQGASTILKSLNDVSVALFRASPRLLLQKDVQKLFSQ
jgi:hypothetical protein